MSKRKVPSFKKVDSHFKDPYSEVIKDIELVQTMIGKFNLIPKFQTGAYPALSFLQFIKSMCAENATHKTCLSGVSKFAFNGDMSVVKSFIAGLKTKRDNTVSESEEQQFLDALTKTGINITQLRDTVKSASRSMKESGDAYIYVKLTKIGEMWATRFESIEYDEFMYWGGKTANDYAVFANPKTGVWCPSWTDSALSDPLRHTVCGVSKLGEGIGNWTKAGANAFETIFHVKNGNASKVYGEAEIFAYLSSFVTEVREDKKMAKIADSATTALSMILFPASPVAYDETQVIEAKDHFDRIGTNRGEGGEVVMGEYFAQDGAPVKIDLSVHRDAAWAKYVEERTSGKIFGFHGWSARLASIASGASGLSTNVYLDELEKTDATTIKPLQEKWEEVISEIFTAIGYLTNNQAFINYSLRFERRIEEMVKRKKEIENGTGDGNIGG